MMALCPLCRVAHEAVVVGRITFIKCPEMGRDELLLGPAWGPVISIEETMPKKDVFTEQRYAKRKIEELQKLEAEALENLPQSVIEQYQAKRVKLLAGISAEACKSLVAMGVIDEVLANRAEAHRQQVVTTAPSDGS